MQRNKSEEKKIEKLKKFEISYQAKLNNRWVEGAGETKTKILLSILFG